MAEPRYIDANILEQKVSKPSMFDINKDDVLALISEIPTADVVPKSECDKWYGEYHHIKSELIKEKMYHRSTEKLAEKYCAEIQTVKNEAVREIFEEIDLIFRNYYEKCSETSELRLLESLRQSERFIINEMWHEVSEIKKKYMERGEGDGYILEIATR